MSPSFVTSEVNSTPKEQMASIPYTLLLYREEIKSRRQSYMHRSWNKLFLTHQLVNKTIKNINRCTFDDLQALTYVSVFKKKLQREIAQTKHKQNIQMWRFQQQQKSELQEDIAESQPQQQENQSQTGET